MILVTGGTGLTGSFVVAELVRRGHAVRVLRRGAGPDAAPGDGVEFASGDLRDPASLARAARGAAGIVHAACTYTDKDADVAAMRALIAAWARGPFVFVSSLDVYGLAGPGPITEDHPLCETYDDYSLGKVLCERLLAEAAASRGRRDHVMLRAPYILGPHPTARRRLVPRRIAEHQPMVLPGADEAEWSRYQDVWIDVRDLATIVAESLVRPAGGPLNVLAGHFSWHDLYTKVIRWTDSRSVLVHKPLDAISDDELPKKRLYAQTWTFSDERLVRQLGAIPRRPFDVTVADTLHGGR